MSPATSIKEVLDRLETIIAGAESCGDRIGYFASLYHKVTSVVKVSIDKGAFDDSLRMEKLDVLFANRYLDALDCWKNNELLTKSWKTAFDVTKTGSALILQHLLLGINAHINFDLGIAAVAAVQDQPLEDIHKDFDTINAIIGSVINEVITEIDHMSPLLSLIGLHANNTDSFLVQFSVGNARDGAWCFAEELSKMSDIQYKECVDARDNDIAKLGSTLANSSGFLKFTLGIIHLFEWKNPQKIIKELNGYKKKFIKARML